MRVLYSALSPDGQTVVTGAADENLKFWTAFEHKKKKRDVAADVGDELVEGMKKVQIR